MFSWLFSDPLPVGSPAPDFTLPDQDGREVSLSRLRGRNVVLVFYPGDDTPVCRRQLCEFRDRWSLAKAKNVAIFGVNPQSLSNHRAFHSRYSFPFPLLVDYAKKVAEMYHASGWWIRRTVYLIDGDGVIRFASRGKPDPEEVLAAAR